jgi:exodeoxyribonuclease-5
VDVLTPNQDQAEALASIRAWYDSDPVEPFVLGGLAGTGKTALLPMLHKSFEWPAPRTRYVCPTWKAANVLTKKLHAAGLGQSATSIHNLIYNPRGILHEPECGTWDDPGSDCTVQPLCKKLAWEYDPKDTPELLVVDEASMVDDRLREDIARLAVPTLYVGDHGQLPPVRGISVFAERRPDAVLERIQRQALDSPIIPLSRLVRNGDRSWLREAARMGFPVLDAGPASKLRYDPRAAVPPHSDPQTVFIAGTNRGVDHLNALSRRVLGRGPESLVVGELVMAQNNNRKLDIYNGQQGVVSKVTPTGFGPEVLLTMETGSQYEGPVLLKGTNEIPKHQVDVPILRHSYAVTCHKAQGSEFENVVVYLTGSRPETKEWLYTAITRATKNLTFVRAGR